MIELGNTTNATADYCLVYNYYPNVENPTSCAVPAQGGYNGGSVIGVYDQDSVNTSLSHTEAYSYDALNRLLTAVATGNSTYNFTFNYDRWGNMTCTTNGQTQGPCPAFSFSSANNHISGFTYDAAGDQLSDSTYTYQYDAEGRVATILQGSSTFETLTYNAHGQAVGETWPVYNDAQEGLFSPAGRELGYYDTVNDNWYDRDIWAAGRMVAQSFPASYRGGFTGYLHANALGSDAQATNQVGASTLDILYYPWGQYWTHAGYESDSHFAGFQQSGGPNYPTPNRTYSGGQGRWLTPDPLGGDITNPQSLNRYAYALNNPTTLTDPLGLDTCYTQNGPVDCPPVIGTSVTVNGGEAPPFWLSLFADFYLNFWPNLPTNFPSPVGHPGGGRVLPPPKPTPLGLRPPSYGQVLRSFNNCAANFADKYSAASVLHLNNVPILGSVLGSSTAAGGAYIPPFGMCANLKCSRPAR